MRSTGVKFGLWSMLLLSGCATIVGSPTQLIPISSTPSDATISITDEKGTEIFKGATPTTVTLQKSNGSYWGKKSYVVRIFKDGFDDQLIPVTASANGWYIGGNLIFGGLIGWLIVDPLNGGMFTLSPENVSANLSSKSAHNNSASDGSIAIMLIEDVPAELRAKMQRIN
jgi:hypothetical protein